ncbi:MAG TPA: tRNA epoxyqueuosine(34) reductase QueG [Bacteroidales bacterium]|nr:tRNA epoxyqueuosine(34) reductase QueG [Bacteroidales bacterium]
MTSSADKSHSLLIKEKAYNLGFDLCGITPSKNLTEHGLRIKNWCSSGMHGDMRYLDQNIEKRINPAILFPGAKSILVSGLNYFSEKKQGGDGIPIISRYAYGADYHDVIKNKLNKLLDYIKYIRPEAEGKAFVDTSPIVEKAWAREAGLGWPGRHSILINDTIGSFFFLGIIITDIELDYDEPFSEDHCGTCRVCIESCPTGAINENRTIDSRKCISYLTVESKVSIPDDLVTKINGRVFGCDICQDVCPWNKLATPHKIPEFNLPKELEQMKLNNWQNLTIEQYKKLFDKSAIARRTYQRFIGNISIATKKAN